MTFSSKILNSKIKKNLGNKKARIVNENGCNFIRGHSGQITDPSPVLPIGATYAIACITYRYYLCRRYF